MGDQPNLMGSFEDEASTAPGRAEGGGREEPPIPRTPPQVSSGSAPAPQQIAPAVPTAPALPDFLGALFGLSPLQQRSAIATYGISSDQAGQYRSTEARNYYRDLFLRNLGLDEEPLPIERQYLTEGLGVFPPDQSREAFLAAIRGL